MSNSEPTQLTEDERAELVRLRAQVAQLSSDHPSKAAGRARWTFAVVCLVLAALLAPLAALATFTRATLLDSDSYLSMVTPLAEDPAVQEEISRRITDAVFEALNVQQLTEQTLQALSERPRVEGVTEVLPVELSTFAEPISNAIYDFTEEQVARLVASDVFQDAWVAANREAHASVVAVLTGEGTASGVEVSEGKVSVDLAEFIETIKPVLVERGVPFAERIPDVSATFVVLDSENLATAQSAVRLLDLLRVVLPVTAILLLVAGVALAPNHRRALVIGSSMIVGSLVLLLLAVQVLRALYLDDLEQVLLVPEVATVLFDAVTTPLTLAVRGTATLFLLIALGAWMAGPSKAAAALRRVPARLAGTTRRPTGAFGAVCRFTADNVTALRATVGGLAVLALLAGDRPSGGTILLVAVILVLALIALEVLRRWGSAAEPQEGQPEALEEAPAETVAVPAQGSAGTP